MIDPNFKRFNSTFHDLCLGMSWHRNSEEISRATLLFHIVATLERTSLSEFWVLLGPTIKYPRGMIIDNSDPYSKYTPTMFTTFWLWSLDQFCCAKVLVESTRTLELQEFLVCHVSSVTIPNIVGRRSPKRPPRKEDPKPWDSVGRCHGSLPAPRKFALARPSSMGPWARTAPCPQVPPERSLTS